MVVDFAYSAGLLMSLLCGAAALVCLLSAAVLRSSAVAARMRVAGSALLALGFVSCVVALVVHRVWGHGARSPEPMQLRQFLGSHPAFVIVGCLLLAGFLLILVARVKSARHERSRDAA